MCLKNYMEYTYTKKLFIVYLKFKFNGGLIFLLDKSGKHIQE